jgi:DNA-directed RNA polymerase III subunit RPC1
MGKTVGLGTGAMEVARKLNFYEGQIGPRKTTFEDAWSQLCEAPVAKRAKRRVR